MKYSSCLSLSKVKGTAKHIRFTPASTRWTHYNNTSSRSTVAHSRRLPHLRPPPPAADYSFRWSITSTRCFYPAGSTWKLFTPRSTFPRFSYERKPPFKCVSQFFMFYSSVTRASDPHN